jgi:hypothetical protein
VDEAFVEAVKDGLPWKTPSSSVLSQSSVVYPVKPLSCLNLIRIRSRYGRVQTNSLE